MYYEQHGLVLIPMAQLTESSQLLLEIQRVCDRIIVTDKINRRYLRLYDELKQTYPHGPELLNFGKQYLLWKQVGKVDDERLSSELPSVSSEIDVKDEDREFVRLACLTNAILVTYDEPLIQLKSKVTCKIMNPTAALRDIRNK